MSRTRFALGVAGAALLAGAAFGVYWYSDDGRRTPAALPEAGPPRALEEVRFQDAAGKTLALSDFRGRAVLVNLWATWCVPCREEMPALDRLQQKLGGPDFEVLAVSIDRGGGADVRRFYEQFGVRSLAVYVDPSAEAGFKLKAFGLPTTVLVDRAGRERWRKVGPAEWDAPPAVQALRNFVIVTQGEK
jgi:thiol-disulfide isomerase/thioredoxin